MPTCAVLWTLTLESAVANPFCNDRLRNARTISDLQVVLEDRGKIFITVESRRPGLQIC